jgi:hypothetical protein
MHEHWAATHLARAGAFEARARADEREATRRDGEAREHEQQALAGAQRAKAAEHRVRAGELHTAEAALSHTERTERGRDRADRRRARARAGMRRFRPGPGSSFYSPGMVGTATASSRHAAIAAEDLDREVDVLVRALEENGATQRDELARMVGARLWGPGRFRAALREALDEGRILRVSRNVYAPAAAGDGDRIQQTPAPRRAAAAADRDA